MSFFRFATIQDIERLTQHVNLAYRGEVSKKGWTTEADLLDGKRTDEAELREMIENHDSWQILCFEDKNEAELLGSVFIKKESDQTLYLGMLTVNPTLQTQGIGKLLLMEVENQAKKLNVKEIRMTVIHLREELLSYYERRGYLKTGREEPFPEDHLRFGRAKVQGLKLLELKKTL